MSTEVKLQRRSTEDIVTITSANVSLLLVQMEYVLKRIQAIEEHLGIANQG